MASVNVEAIMEHLSSQIRRALGSAVEAVVRGDGSFDERDLFRKFKREVGRKCNTWEHVPDSCVRD
jgi:hypothetical protein